MNPIVRNILAVIAGWIVGSIANIALVIVGMMLVPMPGGASPFDPESIKAAVPLFEAKHFAVPLIAHAAGALVGGLVASLIGVSRNLMLAMIVGLLFLLGGIVNTFSIPAPAWFIAVDLLVAYIPMAWLGWKLSGRS
jgi:hypothetical protein